MASDRERDAFYLAVIQELVDGFAAFTGEKIALIKARKAPIDVTPDGRVTGFYGDGKNTVDIVLQQYEAFFGPEIAQHHAQNILESFLDGEHPLPARISERKTRSVWSRLRDQLREIFK